MQEVNFLSKKTARPTLLIHGNKDGLVPYRNAVSFFEKFKTINPNLVKFHHLENGTHMDTASWSYEDNEIRKVILEWIEDLDGD